MVPLCKMIPYPFLVVDLSSRARLAFCSWDSIWTGNEALALIVTGGG